MIQGIDLNCGRSTTSEDLKIDTPPGVTIFVGPNNSGKSALLEGIFKSICETDHGRNQNKVSSLANVRLSQFDPGVVELHPKIRQFKQRKDPEQKLFGCNSVNQLTERLKADWEGPFGRRFRAEICVWMGGRERLSMLTSMDSDLRNPNGRLERLFMDDEKRSAFQKAVFDGIGQYPVIDPVTSFGSGSLRLVFSTEKPSEKFEKTIGQEFISYIDRSTPAGNVSDGYNAYVGMLGAIYSSDNQAVLIDEPEAFLHPTLARSLGRQIARRAANMHVFVATHSSDFLMGAIEAGVDVRIVRLQFNEGVATACLLDSSDLDSFMTDPLLRSSNVMSGLFSKFVIVAEADSDRAFYQEINARLVSSKDARGIDGTVFLNAQNKHTVRRIVGMLRRMGVPTLGVLDLDFVSDGGQNWSALADSLRIPSAMKQSLEIARKVTFDNLRKISTDDDRKNYKTKGGMDLLQNGEREAAEEFLSSLFRYGLAVVPIGEVEAWLGDLEVSRGKRSWLNDIFDKMGAKLSSPDYLSPSPGDVWDFIGECKKWLVDPERKGMDAHSDFC